MTLPFQSMNRFLFQYEGISIIFSLLPVIFSFKASLYINHIFCLEFEWRYIFFSDHVKEHLFFFFPPILLSRILLVNAISFLFFQIRGANYFFLLYIHWDRNVTCFPSFFPLPFFKHKKKTNKKKQTGRKKEAPSKFSSSAKRTDWIWVCTTDSFGQDHQCKQIKKNNNN